MSMGEGYRSFRRTPLYFHLHLMEMPKICRPKARIMYVMPSLEEHKMPVNNSRVTCSMLVELRMVMELRVRGVAVEFGPNRYPLGLFRGSVLEEYGILGILTG